MTSGGNDYVWYWVTGRAYWAPDGDDAEGDDGDARGDVDDLLPRLKPNRPIALLGSGVMVHWFGVFDFRYGTLSGNIFYISC